MLRVLPLAFTITLLLSACGWMEQKKEPPPRLDLNRRLMLVDEEGRAVGQVLLRPLGNGEMRDSNGELLGVIVRPQ